MGFILHWIPAYTIDGVVRLLGRKPFLVKMVGKVQAGIKSLEYFTTHEWKWANDNSVVLQRELNSTDQKYFDFSLRSLHWQRYFDNYFLAGRHQVSAQASRDFYLQHSSQVYKFSLWTHYFMNRRL